MGGGGGRGVVRLYRGPLKFAPGVGGPQFPPGGPYGLVGLGVAEGIGVLSVKARLLFRYDEFAERELGEGDFDVEALALVVHIG